MKQSKYFNKLLGLMMFLVFIGEMLAASGKIEGVIDDNTGELLYGANVILLGTALGSSSDFDGYYVIKNIPEGTYTLKVSYVGYKSQSMEVVITKDTVMVHDFTLEPESYTGEEVVVTAQARGQQQAINQQLSSDNITNVVSSARIQELPDANAAESVGRLPGVSLLRSDGEGDKVVVRGLAPKYNAVTLNGVKLSSSDAGDRGADLSMISSNMLDGIQVSKSVTPDMDANAIGGTVNFQLREAAEGLDGIPKWGFVAQGGTNRLENAKEPFRNYKIEGIFENRNLDGKLGYFIQGSYENRNLASNELSASYNNLGNSNEDYLTQNITLDDFSRIRERGNAVLSVDYKLDDGQIKFSNLFSTSTTEADQRQQFYNVDRGNNQQNFNALYTKSKLSTFSNILNFEKEIAGWDLSATLSHSYSETDNPKDWQVNFVSSSAGIADFGFAANIDPRDVVSAANNDTSTTLLQTVSTTSSFSRERALVAALDFKKEFTLNDDITAIFKFGGKYTHQKRSYDYTATDGQNFGFASGGEIITELQNALSWFRHSPGDNLNVPMNQFIDPNFDYGTFMDSEYEMIYPLNYDKLHEMVNHMYANQLEDNITYNYNVGSSITNDYDGTEDIAAAYLMATVNIGSRITLIPGVRYQQLKTKYKAPQGLQGPNSFSTYSHEWEEVEAVHPYWLPALLIKWKAFNWLDVRAAYTNTLSYPDYQALSPRINVAQSRGTLQYNGFELEPTQSKNFDLSLAFYDNHVGLFTVGGFYKEITDLIYAYSFVPRTGEELLQYYPAWVPTEDRQALTGVTVSTYVNNSYKVENVGMELDWQTHFWYLPGILSGVILNVNYTHIFSEAEYPYQEVIPGRPPKYVDTAYVAPLLYQPDDVLNVTLGFDYEGFSFRLSSLYSAQIFTGPTQWSQLRAFTEASTRWDISVKQKLDLWVQGLEVFANFNNITGERDVSAISASTGVPSRIQSFGSVIELGFRGRF